MDLALDVFSETNINDIKQQSNDETESSFETKSYNKINEESSEKGQKRKFSATEKDRELNPQEKLLKSLKENDFDTFSTLLKRSDVNPKFKYEKPDYTTCIELASRLPKRAKFVKLLLECGVKPNVHEVHHEPIHYAAKEGNFEALEILLQNKKTKINVVDAFERTALHHAVRYSKKGRDEEYAKCIVLLLEREDLDINKPNKKGYTAIHEAANIRKEGVELILKQRSDDLDLDSQRPSGRTARECILQKYPELKNLLPEGKERFLSFDRHSQLLMSFQRRQLQKFKDLLRQVDDNGHARVDPNYIYVKPHNATCLELTCREEDAADYVEMLLNAGADPNVVNINTKQTPLHVAAELGHHKVLSVLLKERRTNVNAVDDDGKSILHLITQHDDDIDKKKTIECLKLVLQNSKINVNIRDKHGQYPVLTALQNGRKSILETFLNNSVNRLDFEQIVEPYNLTLRDAVVQKFPDLKKIFVRIGDRSSFNMDTKLFQLLYDKKQEEFVEMFNSLKDTMEDVKDYNDGNYTFLQYATLHELKDIVRVLLEGGANPNAITPYEKRPPIIIACMRKNNEILNLFFKLDKDKRLNVNAIDAKENTALHYASKNGDLKCVVDLMRQGANIKHKNVFDKPPLPDKSVEYFLDNSINTNDKFPEHEEYQLIFDYSFLVAHRKQNTETYPPQERETPLLGLQNVEVDIQNAESLESRNAEMDFLFYISRSDDHRRLMKHPLITSFLHLKWHRVRLTFFINLCIYILYALLFNYYILSQIGRNDKNTPETSFLILILESIAYCFTSLFLLYFTMREIFQFLLSPKVYYRNFENLLDVSLIIITGYLLLCRPTDWKKPFVVMGILLSWIELILLTGRLPKLSRNIEMLKNVSLNYCWFLFSYIFLIIAFAFSFYSLLHTNAPSNKGINYTMEHGESNETNQHYEFFSSPWLSVLKTFIMMMGEFEASTFLHEMVSFQTCFWLFSLFVFIIAMVLLNLLTGLAVNDTHAIKANADELSLISRIRLVYEIESTLLQWHRFVQDRCTWKLFRPFVILNRFLFRDVSIFPDNSPYSKRIYVLPNKGPKIMYESKQNASASEMDLVIIGTAMSIISSRDKETGMSNIKESFENLRIRIEEQHQKTYNMNEIKLSNIQNTIGQNQVSLQNYQEQMEYKLKELQNGLSKSEDLKSDMRELRKKVESSLQKVDGLEERLKKIETTNRLTNESLNQILNILSDMKNYSQ